MGTSGDPSNMKLVLRRNASDQPSGGDVSTAGLVAVATCYTYCVTVALLH